MVDKDRLPTRLKEDAITSNVGWLYRQLVSLLAWLVTSSVIRASWTRTA